MGHAHPEKVDLLMLLCVASGLATDVIIIFLSTSHIQYYSLGILGGGGDRGGGDRAPSSSLYESTYMYMQGKCLKL